MKKVFLIMLGTFITSTFTIAQTKNITKENSKQEQPHVDFMGHLIITFHNGVINIFCPGPDDEICFRYYLSTGKGQNAFIETKKGKFKVKRLVETFGEKNERRFIVYK